MNEDTNNTRNDMDAAIQDMAQDVVRICEEKKAADIVLFHVEEQSILADYYLVCCGLSLPHIRAVADAIRRQMLDAGFRLHSQEGTPSSQWIILDYGVILIHIMTPAMRRHYTMEELWDKRLIVYEGGEELPEEMPENDFGENESMKEEDDQSMDADENEAMPFDFDDNEEDGEEDTEAEGDFEEDGEPFEEEEEVEEDLLFDDEEKASQPPREETPEDQEFRAKLFGMDASASTKNADKGKTPSLNDLFGK